MYGDGQYNHDGSTQDRLGHGSVEFQEYIFEI